MSTQKTNRVLFIVDRSGSMQGIMPAAIVALNQNIKTIKEQVKESGQDATVSLVTFSDDVEMQFFNRSISAVEELGDRAISTSGMTALLDAVGYGIEQLEGLPVGTDDDVSYLVIAITDGQENRSQCFNSRTLGTLMKRVQATDRWTLTFLVPRGDKRALVSSFGIPEGNVMEWEATAAGVNRYATANSAGITRYFRGRAAGERSMRSFYTDMSQVSVTDVKRQLDDLSGRATLLEVDRDSDIRSFIESRGLTFMKGAAFYQLVPGKENADKVQDYKKVLITEKGGSKVYGGDDARHLLGLPDSETKVRPGDNGKFDIFIQSTSTNRKVLRGTRVIYMPSAAR